MQCVNMQKQWRCRLGKNKDLQVKIDHQEAVVGNHGRFSTRKEQRASKICYDAAIPLIPFAKFIIKCYILAVGIFCFGGSLSMQNQVSEDIMNRIKRFVDEYGWDWIVVKQVVNNYYGTQYTVSQIRKIYESNECGKGF